MPEEIQTIEGFESTKNSKSVVIVHFWAEWNATDFSMKKILKELESSFSENVTFVSINVDNENLFALCRNIPVVNVPTLLFIKDSKSISVDIGLNPKELEKEKEKIAVKIDSLINS